MSFNLPGVKPGSDIETLYKAVGYVVVQWGFAEQALDLMIANIFHYLGGHPMLKRRPQNLTSKIEFLDNCFTEIPELAQFRAECQALLPRFTVAGIKRNDLVHGSISDMKIKDGGLEFIKIDVKPTDNHSVRAVFFNESDWPEFQKELLRLGRDGQTLARRMLDSLKVLP